MFIVMGYSLYSCLFGGVGSVLNGRLSAGLGKIYVVMSTWHDNCFLRRDAAYC